MGKVRVLIADDSFLARELLRELLESDPGIEVIGEAGDGRRAVELARSLKPDLVTMDLEMPVMGGLEAIREIMCSRAIPILVVSSVADARNACEAVARGALEVMAKPELDPALAKGLAEKVKMLARVPVITHLRSRTPAIEAAAPAGSPFAALARPFPPDPEPPAWPDPPQGPGESHQRLIAIAASTGGPQALSYIASRLPAAFPVPIVVAQHIADGFAGGMAEWLDGLCPLKVELARDAELIQPGHIYISPSESHLTVTPARRLRLLPREPQELYRPSCDRLLTSAAEVYGRHAVGVILTGMGHDGVAGIERITAAGGLTFAQDELSSVVYGMNKIAVDHGAVHRVLPLDALPAELLRLAGSATALRQPS